MARSMCGTASDGRPSSISTRLRLRCAFTCEESSSSARPNAASAPVRSPDFQDDIPTM